MSGVIPSSNVYVPLSSSSIAPDENCKLQIRTFLAHWCRNVGQTVYHDRELNSTTCSISHPHSKNICSVGMRQKIGILCIVHSRHDDCKSPQLFIHPTTCNSHVHVPSISLMRSTLFTICCEKAIVSRLMYNLWWALIDLDYSQIWPGDHSFNRLHAEHPRPERLACIYLPDMQRDE